MWEDGAFDAVFSETGDALEARPTDYFLLTMRGFSAYQLGVSQVDGTAAMDYFDESIRALRRAMILREGESDGRLFYVLGKAYFQKDDGFADMTIEYLEKARALGYAASDIPEFLGLAYYAVGDYLSSVVAFTRALETTRPSARLLFSIAASYAALDDFDNARAYLVRCKDVSVDSKVTIDARIFLADVLRRAGDADGAERELMGVLEETGENAEARFRLGELYAEKGDGVRARAEWRRARDIDPTNLKAIARLSL
jgi:tetratricopeptide (TPR) repeat protein